MLNQYLALNFPTNRGGPPPEHANAPGTSRGAAELKKVNQPLPNKQPRPLAQPITHNMSLAAGRWLHGATHASGAPNDLNCFLWVMKGPLFAGLLKVSVGSFANVKTVGFDSGLRHLAIFIRRPSLTHSFPTDAKNGL